MASDSVTVRVLVRPPTLRAASDVASRIFAGVWLPSRFYGWYVWGLMSSTLNRRFSSRAKLYNRENKNLFHNRQSFALSLRSIDIAKKERQHGTEKKTWAPNELATYYAIICFSRETLPRNQLNSEDIDARRVTKALRNKNQHLPLSPLGLLLLLRLFCGFNSELVLVRSMS